MKLENLIILQNNFDLIKEAQALAHQNSIAAFVKDVSLVAWVRTHSRNRRDISATENASQVLAKSTAVSILVFDMLACSTENLEFESSPFLIYRLLGARSHDKKQTKDELLLSSNIDSTSTGGRVLSVKEASPACIGENVALTRRFEKHWRLVGEYSCDRSGKCAAWNWSWTDSRPTFLRLM
ncbi:hypothetical protein BDR06DRAFT_1002610 [Suillus hirtellus]|nr:hypothetical protein BDR06DRAFT_1002610 [Suillus hirtellus]